MGARPRDAVPWAGGHGPGARRDGAAPSCGPSPRTRRVGDPFGAARALLALGLARRGASEAVGPRRDRGVDRGFAALGAAGWAGRARAELGRVGGRQREVGLSAAERRVAALVAEGRTNREVSAALFLAERTVASHLTHIYAKLGVRSRTELARRMR